MGEVVFAFREPHFFAGFKGRHCDGQGMRVGEPNVLRSKNDESAREETGVFPTLQHFEGPIKRGIRVGTANAFDHRRGVVVVLVFIAVVANPAFPGEGFDRFLPDGGTVGLTQHEGFEGVEGTPEIPTGKFRQRLENFRIGFAIMGAQSPLRLAHRFLQHLRHRIGVDEFEAKEMTAAQERRVHIKTGIVGSGTNESNIARLDVGQ